MRNIVAIGLLSGITCALLLTSACSDKFAARHDDEATGRAVAKLDTPPSPPPIMPTSCCATGQTPISPAPAKLSDLPECRAFNPGGGSLPVSVMGDQLAKCMSQATCTLGRSLTAIEFMRATNFGGQDLVCNSSTRSAQEAICYPDEPCYRRRCIDPIGGFGTGVWCSIRLGDRGEDSNIECLDAVAPDCGAAPREINLPSSCSDNAQGKLGAPIAAEKIEEKCGGCHKSVPKAARNEFGCMAMPQNFTCPLDITVTTDAQGTETIVPAPAPIRGPESSSAGDVCELLKGLWNDPLAPAAPREDTLQVATNRGCPWTRTRMLTINVTGSGSVHSWGTPADGVSTHGCGANAGGEANACSARYWARNTVKLTASPGVGTHVVWSGKCNETDGNTCIVNMWPQFPTPGSSVPDLAVTATFVDDTSSGG